jgi:hypothetical protein
MTLVPGNALTLALGKQTAKGTAQATPQAKVDYIGGFGPEPNWATLQTAETDATRQLADLIRVGFSVVGQSEHYLRPDEHHYFAHAILGATATSGTTNKTHVATPTVDGAAPYYTLFRAVDVSSEVTKMVDNQASQIQWTGGAGQALSALIDWVGLSAILGATDPAATVSSQAVLVYPQVTATYGGVHDGSVQSFQITVNQNRTPWIGDTGTTAFDIVPGQLEVTAQLVMLFQNDQEYRNFLTGSTSGTAPAVAIPSKALSVIAAIDANNSIQWDIAAAQITNYSRAFNTDGSPLLATITLKSKKDVTTIGNVVTVTTKNTVAAP